jgi:hypothetical protein
MRAAPAIREITAAAEAGRRQALDAFRAGEGERLLGT